MKRPSFLWGNLKKQLILKMYFSIKYKYRGLQTPFISGLFYLPTYAIYS